MKAKFSYYPSEIRKILSSKVEEKVWDERSFSEITISSLEVDSSSLFVPLMGQRDGHQFIGDAMERGALGFLYDPKKFTPPQSILRKGIPVDDTRLALGRLSGFHRRRFLPLVIAITGSNGKTTTKEFLSGIFQFLPDEEKVITEKNYNNDIGLPFTLFNIDKKTKIVILEMGMNHLGEISYLSKLAKPDITFITNIGSAHIENLGSRENIAIAKSEIIDGMENGSLYVPQNLDYKDIVSKKCKENSVSLIEWELLNHEMLEINSILIHYNEKEISFPYPSKDLLNNWSGVTKLSEDIGIPKDVIANGLSHFQPAKGRLNILSGEFKIIDDCYNANLESMKSSINIAKNLAKDHNLILILGDIKEAGQFSKEIHSELGSFINDLNIHFLITYGEDSQFISKHFQGDSLHLNQGKDSVDQIFRILQQKIKKNDVILIKGSRSMKMEEIVEILDSKLNQKKV